MIPNGVIAAIDIIAAAAVAATLVLMLVRVRHFHGPARLLLLAMLIILFIIADGNMLEWMGLFPRADAPEDFIEPFVPTLWLFLFVVELERASRERLRRGFAQLIAVHNLASKLTVTLVPEAIMEEVVETASRLLDAPFTAILTPDKASGDLAVRAARGITPEEAAAIRIPPGVGIGGRAFVDRRRHLTDGPADTFAPTMAPIAARHRLTHGVSVPMIFRGEVVGLLNVGKSRGDAFTENDLALLETLCAHAAVAIENARLYEQVAESEAKYRLLVENAQVAIIVVDGNRNILFWNQGARRLFGWTAEETRGQHINRIYPPDKLEDVAREILPPLDREGLWSGEFPLVRQDGSAFTGFLSLARVLDATGGIICTLGVVTDVTERVQLREQLIQAQKMETVGTLAGGLAHDFNNLLMAILGFGGLLESSLPPGSEDRDAAVNINRAAQRGTQLVRQLMTFSHRQPTRVEPVDLNAVATEVCELIRRTFPKTIEVVTQLAPDLHVIRGDPTQMHQVLMNLAINSRDAMPGGGTLTIATRNLDLALDDPRAVGIKPGPCVGLTVSDTGQGIPPEAQPHVFEPFYTTKPISTGTGLGLATVYAIVKRHNGRITFKTQVGHGTDFCIILPALRPKATAPAAPLPTEAR